MRLFKKGRKKTTQKKNMANSGQVELEDLVTDSGAREEAGTSFNAEGPDSPGGTIQAEVKNSTQADAAAKALKSVGRGLWSSLLDKSQWPRRLTVTVFALICVSAISFAFLWQVDNKAVYRQRAGEVALDNVVSPRDLTYTSKILTQAAQERNADDPANQVYRRDEGIVATQRSGLSGLLDAINQARGSGILAPSVLKLNPVVTAARLSDGDLSALSALDNATWNTVAAEARNSFNSLMTRNIRPDQLQDQLTQLNAEIYTPWTLSPTFAQLDTNNRKLVINLIKPFVVSNSVLDLEATKNKRQEARDKTPDVSQNVAKGQNLIRKGDIITPLQVEEMEHLGLRNSFDDWQNIAGTVGIIAMLVLILCFYFGQLFTNIWNNRKMLAFITLSLVVAAVAIRLLVDNHERTLRPYLLPLAAIGMVVAALLDVQVALLLAALLALLIGLVSGTPELALVFFAGGASGALSLWKADRTSAFAFAGLAVVASQFVMGICYSLIVNSLDPNQLGLLLVFNMANGLISTSLAFFCFSVLGKMFGVTTVITLLELAHPNQPLLRRLMREAPGTYHHSMLVGTLAEQAAEHIAGDALLARVGAYYHDIGKLERPLYFIDNQGGGPNIHDTLDPRQSASIIRKHVEDGVRLARENHLPNRVIDIIHQHHGTCLISYFYNKAITMGLDVSEIDFRYPGPKPQSKISALVMLADGSEAAVRANVQSGRILTGQTQAIMPANPNQEITNNGKRFTTINEVVNKIFDDRMRDGQLDECDLTLRDIEQIRKLFVEILTSIYHPRVDYPEPAKTPKPPEEQVVVGSAVVLSPEPARLGAAADGGSPTTTSLAPVIPQAESDVKKEQPENPGTSTQPRPKPSGGIGGAGRRIGQDRERENNS